MQGLLSILCARGQLCWAHRLCVNDPVPGLMSGPRPHPFPWRVLRALGVVASTMDRVLVFWLSLGNLGRLCSGPWSPLSPMHTVG